MNKRFVRPVNDRMLAGVCSGVAQYFDIDPTIVRLIFVVSVLSGVSPLLYVVMWIVMPEAGDAANVPAPSTASTSTQNPTGEWKYDPYTGERLNS